MKLVTQSEHLLYATVRLLSKTSSATGFIFQTSNDNYIIISNRHFVEKKEINELDYTITQLNDYVEFYVHLDDGNNYLIQSDVIWYLHPSTDLAFFHLDPLLSINSSNVAPKKFCLFYIDSSIIPTQQQLDDLTAVENVFMYGYPSGQFDSVNNFPLVRSGVTSSHPAVNYKGQPQGLIDIPCIPGSSGSPVLIVNEGIYFQKNIGSVCGKRIYLLGIEYASPMRYLNEIIQELPDPNNPGTKIYNKISNLYLRIDMSLGMYIKSSEIYGFNNQFKNLGI